MPICLPTVGVYLIAPMVGPAESTAVPSAPIAARKFGNGPMRPVPGLTWACPVSRSRVRTSRGESVVPRDFATLDSDAAALATMGEALDVPPKPVYHWLTPMPAYRSPYPVVVTHSPQPWRSTRRP